MKEKYTNNSVNKSQFPLDKRLETSLKRIYTVISWEINNARAYLNELRDTYRFYSTQQSSSSQFRNFPNFYQNTDGAYDASLVRLGNAFNIQELTFSRIFFEWETKFLAKTTDEGIANFVRLFFKYELVDRFMEENIAEEISSNIEIILRSWYDNEISEIDNVYSYDDLNPLSLYLEIIIPPEYIKYYANIKPKLINLGQLLATVVVPTAKIEFIEVSWS